MLKLHTHKPALVRKVNNIATGQAVRFVREQKGISLRKMAKLIGVVPSFLSDLERGKRNWTIKHFEKIRKILK